ncbi:hypothetical protein JVX98_27125 [Ensifer sp. PDNC004]|uniref:hypothetical protein n=1 Tax=Ensifer sp. PDNC004 TaxID=2811423 RepID=UPI0019652FA5|nr:hypothetical protein [Ensifer sp. PDNC004]QRY67973.1 hypothetical protein JVX98_27125 [Ensifer sp. PDNC004]
MTKAMEELRAAMMRTKQFNWWQRKELRWLSPKNEEQRQVVMNALGPDHVLMARMIRCGEISSNNNMFYCGIPLCPRCFMRERGRQTRQAIRETFLDANNDDIAFVTILLPARTDLADVHGVIEKEKRRLRNFIVRQRSLDSRWDDFQFVGFWEMGRTTIGDFQCAGRKTKLALNSLEFPLIGADDETVWLPHLHAIVQKGRLTEKEIAKALRNDGHHAPYQVDVRPFHTYRSAAKNLQNVTRYSLKFRIENDPQQLDPLDFITAEKDPSGVRDWWPADDIRAYVEWLYLERSGFQSLRFVLGKKDVDAGTDIALAVNQEDDDIESSFDRSLCSQFDENVSDECSETESDVNADDSCDVSLDVLFDINARVECVSGSVRYNNLLLDTNWITVDVPKWRPMLPATLEVLGHDAKAAAKSSRYAGNVLSLAERLRSIGVLDRASGDH